jgi:sterol desaturase/sphingolipid hydroxylase (fatty acid hydroxylase superfamily)
MNALQNIILVFIILGFAGIEYWTGKTKTINASKDDNKLELFMFISLVAFTQPFIFFVTSKAGVLWFPEYKNALANLPIWAMVGILLVGDDMTQYWWHRISHSPLMWPLHRAHHTAHYMSMRMTYRNNFFYYLMMPGIWVSGSSSSNQWPPLSR